MPLYEFVAKVGRKIVGRVTLPIPVEERDKVAFTRSTIPERVAISGSAEAAMPNPTLRALHRIEQRTGTTRDFHRRLGFTPETIKRVWKEPAIT